MCAALGITDDQTQSPTIAAVRALNLLIHDARDLIPIAEARGRRHMAQRLNTIASQLDACRTRLVQEGPDYIETAWAWVDSGRIALANYLVVLS